MQPTQRAAEEIRRVGEAPGQFVKKAGTYAAGAAISSRIVPFLSQYIPYDLFKKGLTKVDPRLGKFIDHVEEEGAEPEEIKGFIQSKIDNHEQGQKAKNERNIIEKYDPELHTYIKEKIGKGEHPIKAGASALGHRRFKNAINKIMKDYNTSWDKVLESVYGQGEQAQPSQVAPQQEQMINNPQSGQGGQGGNAWAEMARVAKEILNS